MRLTFSGNRPATWMAEYVQNVLRPRLQTIPGVGEVSLFGYRERNVRVWLDAATRTQSLTVQDVVRAIQREDPEDRPPSSETGRPLSQQELMDVMRRVANQIPGIRASVQDLSQPGFSASRGYPVELSVRGRHWATLAEKSEWNPGALGRTDPHRAEAQPSSDHSARPRARHYDFRQSAPGASQAEAIDFSLDAAQSILPAGYRATASPPPTASSTTSSTGAKPEGESALIS